MPKGGSLGRSRPASSHEPTGRSACPLRCHGYLGAALSAGRLFLLPGAELGLVWPASRAALPATYLLGLRDAVGGPPQVAETPAPS